MEILFSFQSQQKFKIFSKKSEILQKWAPMILKLNLLTHEWEDQSRRIKQI